jgi:hypothetical protein
MNTFLAVTNFGLWAFLGSRLMDLNDPTSDLGIYTGVGSIVALWIWYRSSIQNKKKAETE